MKHLRQLLVMSAVVTIVSTLSACVPQIVSQGKKVSNESPAPVATDQGALSPDIKKILAAGGLDAANPAGPADIPPKIGSPAPEPEKAATVTEIATPTTVNGVLQSPGAYPAGDMNVGELSSVLPSVSQFMPPPRKIGTKPSPVRAAKSKLKGVVAITHDSKNREVSTPKVRRF